MSRKTKGLAPAESDSDYKHSAFVEEDRIKAIKLLLGETDLSIDGDSDLGYETNDNRKRSARNRQE